MCAPVCMQGNPCIMDCAMNPWALENQSAFPEAPEFPTTAH